MINEGNKRVLFTKKQITTLANEFAGFFKGFTFGKEGEALLSKEILKQYFQEALKHDTYEESVDITKPKLSLFLKMIKRDDSIFFRLYEVKNRKESDILKITLNSTTNNWSVRRLDLNERETMKSKIIKEGYSNNGYGDDEYDVKIDFKDLNESFNRILKEYNGADDTDVVIYTGRNIKAWIPTDSAYARDLARGWITVIIYNEKTHEEIWLEGTNDGDFMVSQIDGRSANEDFDESACAEYLSCDEEEAESIYKNISNYDYGEFFVGLLDGTEDDPTHEMVQEAIAEAKQDSKENLIEFACEFADEDSCSEINDEMADEIIEKYNEYGVYDDFYVEWEWDGNPVVEPITYGEGSDPRIIKAIKYVLFAHGILSDEALEEMHSQGIYPEEEDNDQTDLFESYNMLYRRYLNEDDSYKWDKELDTDDLQYLIDQEFPKYEDRYEFSEHPQADHSAVDTFDTFLRRCKNIVEKFADENGLSFYDILEDIRGPYQLAIYNYLNGDLSHIMNDHPKKLDLDAMARDDIKPQFEHLQKAIRNCIKSYIV